MRASVRVGLLLGSAIVAGCDTGGTLGTVPTTPPATSSPPTSSPTSPPTEPTTPPDTTDTDTGTPPGTTPTDTGGCPPVTDLTTTVIVTDIDETLTTSDGEWLTQIANPSHDPAMRPDANTLMTSYVALGYRVFYVTARGEGLRLLDGTPARDATEDWLALHGFPFTSDGVFLAGGLGALTDQAATDYKTGVIEDLQDQGFEVVWAYGNAESDIAAYQAVGVPDTDIFLVGALAGQLGVVGIPDDEAYTDHLATFLPSVGCGH